VSALPFAEEQECSLWRWREKSYKSFTSKTMNDNYEIYMPPRCFVRYMNQHPRNSRPRNIILVQLTSSLLSLLPATSAASEMDEVIHTPTISSRTLRKYIAHVLTGMYTARPSLSCGMDSLLESFCVKSLASLPMVEIVESLSISSKVLRSSHLCYFRTSPCSLHSCFYCS
jgi:hypothetical protein